MARGFQRWELIGNMGADAELRYTKTGQPVAGFRMAVNTAYKKDGTLVEQTDWYKVTVWGNLAENVAKFTAKGSLVRVEGSKPPKLTTYEKDGEWHAAAEWTAHTVQFLSSPNGAVTGGGGTSGGYSNDDEMPF